MLVLKVSLVKKDKKVKVAELAFPECKYEQQYIFMIAFYN